MSYLKLIKLLYFADREALLDWGRPITTDRYVSMQNGPVVSQIYNLIIEGQAPGAKSYWRKYISEPKNYEVSLLCDDIPHAELSKAEEDLLDSIFERFGRKNRWALVDISHEFLEWHDPKGSATPIEYRDIFQAGDKTPLEIAELEEELSSLAYADHIAFAHR